MKSYQETRGEASISDLSDKTNPDTDLLEDKPEVPSEGNGSQNLPPLAPPGKHMPPPIGQPSADSPATSSFDHTTSQREASRVPSTTHVPPTPGHKISQGHHGGSPVDKAAASPSRPAVAYQVKYADKPTASRIAPLRSSSTLRRREQRERSDENVVERLRALCTDADPTQLYQNLVRIAQG